MVQTEDNETDGPAARRLCQAMIEQLARGSWLGLLELYAEDVLVELPFALEHERVIRGREALAERIARAEQLEIQLHPRNVRVYCDEAANVAILEFDYIGMAVRTGLPFSGSSVRVLHLDGCGRIGEMRAYHDTHALMAAAVGPEPQA